MAYPNQQAKKKPAGKNRPETEAKSKPAGKAEPKSKPKDTPPPKKAAAPKAKEKKPKDSGKPKAPSSGGGGLFRLRFWLKLAMVLLVLGAIVPVLEVLYVRYYQPPVTTLMLVRRVEGMFSKEYKGNIQYHWVPLREIAMDFHKAVWVAEDERFFQHTGIDWKEVELAKAEAKKTGKPPRGASTITMQCARTVFLWQGRSWIRKGLEVGYTYLLENLTSKRRIFELYVNTVELGDGIYGVDAAARKYYNKPASRLNQREAAMLAAMLPYPRGWDPKNPSPRLRRRHTMILHKMQTTRFPADKLFPEKRASKAKR